MPNIGSEVTGRGECGSSSIACESWVMQQVVHRQSTVTNRQEEARHSFQKIPYQQWSPREDLTRLEFMTANSSDTKTFIGKQLYTS
jgi:hypothetical protein